MDTARKMRIWRLLHEVGESYVGRWEELKFLLTPFIAQNEQEQIRFYAIFEEFVRECKAAESPNPPETPPWWKKHGKTLAATAIVGLLIATLVTLLDTWDQPQRASVPVKMQKPLQRLIPADSLFYLKNLTTLTAEDSNAFQWVIRDETSTEPDTIITAPHLAWIPRRGGSRKWVVLMAISPDTVHFNPLKDSVLITIGCSDPPAIEKAGISPAEGEVLVVGRSYAFSFRDHAEADSVRWIFEEADTLEGEEVMYSFKSASGEGGVLLQVYRGPYCVWGEPLSYSCVDPPDTRFNSWYWLLVLLLLFLAPGLLRAWFEQYKPRSTVGKAQVELDETYPIHDRAPYDIPYREQTGNIRVPPQFFRMAEMLRRREEGQWREFDSRSSVAATVASGGFPSWRDKGLSRPVEYLILMQRREERNQQDRLLERWVLFLQQQDAPVRLFYHDGRFERVWETLGQSIHLDRLYRDYPHHRLILLGDAHGLVNPGPSPRPMLVRQRLRHLLNWDRRLVLTPSPAEDWAWQEGLLYEHFLLYPMTTEGMLAGIEALDLREEYLPGDPNHAFVEARRRFCEAGVRHQPLTTPEELRAWLADDPELFRWVCALAVAVRPDWSLTLAIGQALGMTISHDRLLRLSRIPWLAQNRPANALRIDLLCDLSPTDTRIARQCLIDELEAVKDQVAGSFAESLHTADLAVQYFALHPRNTDYKQGIRELRDAGILVLEQQEELDFVVQEQAEGSDLPAAAKQNLQSWLDTPEPAPVAQGQGETESGPVHLTPIKRFWALMLMWLGVACVLEVILLNVLQAGRMYPLFFPGLLTGLVGLYFVIRNKSITPTWGRVIYFLGIAGATVVMSVYAFDRHYGTILAVVVISAVLLVGLCMATIFFAGGNQRVKLVQARFLLISYLMIAFCTEAVLGGDWWGGSCWNPFNIEYFGFFSLLMLVAIGGVIFITKENDHKPLSAPVRLTSIQRFLSLMWVGGAFVLEAILLGYVHTDGEIPLFFPGLLTGLVGLYFVIRNKGITSIWGRVIYFPGIAGAALVMSVYAFDRHYGTILALVVILAGLFLGIGMVAIFFLGGNQRVKPIQERFLFISYLVIAFCTEVALGGEWWGGTCRDPFNLECFGFIWLLMFVAIGVAIYINKGNDYKPLSSPIQPTSLQKFLPLRWFFGAILLESILLFLGIGDGGAPFFFPGVLAGLVGLYFFIRNRSITPTWGRVIYFLGIGGVALATSIYIYSGDEALGSFAILAGALLGFGMITTFFIGGNNPIKPLQARLLLVSYLVIAFGSEVTLGGEWWGGTCINPFNLECFGFIWLLMFVAIGVAIYITKGNDYKP